MNQMELTLRSFMQQSYKPPTIISELWDREDVTPDIEKIRYHRYIPIVVYCNLKGCFDFGHKVFEKSLFLGEAMTASNNFRMYTDATGDAVVIQRSMNAISSTWLRVRGHAWAIPPETLCSLDRYFQNDYKMFRKKVSFFLLDQVVNTTRKGKTINPSVPCYMYLGSPDYYFLGQNAKGLKMKNVMTPVSTGNNKKSSYYSHWQGLY